MKRGRGRFGKKDYADLPGLARARDSRRMRLHDGDAPKHVLQRERGVDADSWNHDRAVRIVSVAAASRCRVPPQAELAAARQESDTKTDKRLIGALIINLFIYVTGGILNNFCDRQIQMMKHRRR